MSVRTRTVGPWPFLRTPTTPCAADLLGHLEAERLQFLGHAGGGLFFLEREFRMSVNVVKLLKAAEFVLDRRQLKRHQSCRPRAVAGSSPVLDVEKDNWTGQQEEASNTS